MNPDEHTIQEFLLDVGDGHQLYGQEWGNKKAATPVIVLHGGPGYHCKDRDRSSFDPAHHRVVFFDQRGCGKSTPNGSLEHNTTDDLLGDITKIADHVGAKNFVLYGASWGSALALAYTIAFPERVRALVLASIFTASREECHWIDEGRFRTFHPEAWQRFLDKTPAEHHKNPAAYHYKNIQAGDAHLLFNSALALSEMEHHIISLNDRLAPIDPATFDPTGARILAHYFTQNCFMPDRFILENAHKITVPTWLVHGRYDMDCPPVTAYELHQKIAGSHLTFVISNHRIEHEAESVLRAILLQLRELE